MDNEEKNIFDIVGEIADFANSVASLVVGHRRILVEGDFDVNLADSMAASLHAHLLGLVHHWESADDFDIIAYANEEDDDDE